MNKHSLIHEITRLEKNIARLEKRNFLELDGLQAEKRELTSDYYCNFLSKSEYEELNTEIDTEIRHEAIYSIKSSLYL